jgi:hypothetical protein
MKLTVQLQLQCKLSIKSLHPFPVQTTSDNKWHTIRFSFRKALFFLLTCHFSLNANSTFKALVSAHMASLFFSIIFKYEQDPMQSTAYNTVSRLKLYGTKPLFSHRTSWCGAKLLYSAIVWTWIKSFYIGRLRNKYLKSCHICHQVISVFNSSMVYLKILPGAQTDSTEQQDN